MFELEDRMSAFGDLGPEKFEARHMLEAVKKAV